MTRLATFFGLSLCFAPMFAAGQAPEITSKAELTAFVDGVVESGLAQNNVAGAVVAIVKDYDVLLAKGYGYADVANQVPVDPYTTMFRVGSVTKLFTWTALMQLEEQGLLDLNADVNGYLSTIEVPPTFPEPITVANLMTHTGGLEDRIIGLFSLDPASMRPYGELLSQDLPERVREPGWVSSYSNHGVGLAGLVVEEISGQTWPEYVETHILEPLGMSHSTAWQPVPEHLQVHSSNGYAFENGRFSAKPFEFVPLGAAGGMSASAVDMLQFAMAHLNDGALPNGARILEEASARQMRTDLFRPHPELNGWLYGFADYSRNDVAIYGHSGGTFYFFTEFALFPEENLGIFISTNTVGGGQILNQLFRGLLERYFPFDYAAPEPGSATGLERYAGSYATFRHPVTTVGKLLRLMATVDISATGDGELRLVGSGPPSYWRQTSPGVFRNVERDRTLRFVDDPQGQLLFIDSAGGSFYKLSLFEAPAFQYTVGGTALLLLGWALLAWPVQRARRGEWLVGLEQRSRMVAWLIALTLFVCLAGIAGNASQEIVYGLPTTISVLLWLPFLTMALLLVYLVLLAGMIRDDTIEVATKVFHLALALAATVVCWLFAYWNLIGN